MKEVQLVPPCSVQSVDQFVSEPPDEVVETLRQVEGDVLVLGAGGKMGLHLALMIQRAFDRLGKASNVIAVSRFRSESSKALFETYGIRVVACDLGDRDSVEALPKAEVVFFLAGIKFGTASSPEVLHHFNVEMPRLVAHRFRDATIIAFSTGCVYPFVSVSSGGSKEEDLPQPVGEYAKTCLGRENAFTDGAAKFGNRVAIIRLNYAVELRYGVLVDVGKKVLNEEPVDVGMGYVNVIWQGDAIEQIIRSMEYATQPPFILNVTGPETISVRQLAAQFGSRFGKSPIITGEEADTAWLSNAGRAHRLFGLPRTGLIEMTDWTAAWLLSRYPTWEKPTHFENRSGQF